MIRQAINLQISRATRSAVSKVLMATALSASLAGCLGYDGDLQHGYVIDDRLIDQVKTGSSAEQVLLVMGSPSTTSTIGGSAWYYISSQTRQAFAFQKPTVVDRRVFAVYFDAKKRVERVANYGLADGRVFDFNSNTTPTAGAETAFVSNMLKNLLRFDPVAPS